MRSLLDLRPLLEPGSVAVIGASARVERPGYSLTRNILEGGFPGRVYPVNPKREGFLGLTTFDSISSVPEPVDLAFIVVNRRLVRQAVQQCVDANVGAICIVTAGFAESDGWGTSEQEAIQDIINRTNVVAIGPNTIGFVSSPSKLVGTFVPFSRWEEGGVAIVAQTGIYAGATALEIMTAPTQRLGIGISVDIGNRIGISEIDLLTELSRREEVSTIGFYIEEFEDAPKFLHSAKEVNPDKPIVVLKSGRTEQGAEASASHTGALTGADDVLDQLLFQHGITRAADEREFLDLLKAFSYAPAPNGRRVGIVTYSGALGVIAVDEIVANGLELAEINHEALRSSTADLTPDWQNLGNPADMWSAVEVNPSRAARLSFEAMLADSNVDQVLGVLLAVPPADFAGLRDMFRDLRQKYTTKPIHMFMTGGLRSEWAEKIDGLGIPIYESLRQAARAMAQVSRYSESRSI